MAAEETKAINDLSDSDFAFISPGGTKDAEGKTTPRSLRHLPIHDAEHVRNALARLNQTDIPAEAKKQALAKILRAAKKFGVKAAAAEEATKGDDLDALVASLTDAEIVTMIETLSRDDLGDEGDHMAKEKDEKDKDTQVPATPLLDGLVTKLSRDKECEDLVLTAQGVAKATGADLTTELVATFERTAADRAAAKAKANEIAELNRKVAEQAATVADLTTKQAKAEAFIEEAGRRQKMAEVDVILTKRGLEEFPMVMKRLMKYARHDFMTTSHKVMLSKEDMTAEQQIKLTATETSKELDVTPLDVVMECLDALPKELKLQYLTTAQTHHGDGVDRPGMEEARKTLDLATAGWRDGKVASGLSGKELDESVTAFRTRKSIELGLTQGNGK